MFPLDIRKSFLLISSKEEAIISGESSVHLKSIEPLQKATHLANLVTNAHCGREPVSRVVGSNSTADQIDRNRERRAS